MCIHKKKKKRSHIESRARKKFEIFRNKPGFFIKWESCY